MWMKSWTRNNYLITMLIEVLMHLQRHGSTNSSTGSCWGQVTHALAYPPRSAQNCR